MRFQEQASPVAVSPCPCLHPKSTSPLLTLSTRPTLTSTLDPPCSNTCTCYDASFASCEHFRLATAHSQCFTAMSFAPYISSFCSYDGSHIRRGFTRW